MSEKKLGEVGLAKLIEKIKNADSALATSIATKQDTLDISYDASNHRLNFNNVAFTIEEND